MCTKNLDLRYNWFLLFQTYFSTYCCAKSVCACVSVRQLPFVYNPFGYNLPTTSATTITQAAEDSTLANTSEDKSQKETNQTA